MPKILCLFLCFILLLSSFVEAEISYSIDESESYYISEVAVKAEAEAEADSKQSQKISPYKAPEVQGFSLGRKAPPFFFEKISMYMLLILYIVLI